MASIVSNYTWLEHFGKCFFVKINSTMHNCSYINVHALNTQFLNTWQPWSLQHATGFSYDW